MKGLKALKKLFSSIFDAVRSGEDVVMVSVIGESGSTPRGAGARMAVWKDGTSVGTIGGGAVEYRATQLAVEALEGKKSYIHGFRLRPNDIADLGMICGGDLEVFFQYIKGTSENAALFEEIVRSAGQGCRFLACHRNPGRGQMENADLP